MFDPSPESAAALLRDTANMLYRLQSEVGRELGHLEGILKDSVAALYNRKPTHQLVSAIGSGQTALQGAAGAISREMQDIEQVVQELHNMVMRLEASW